MPIQINFSKFHRQFNPNSSESVFFNVLSSTSTHLQTLWTITANYGLRLIFFVNTNDRQGRLKAIGGPRLDSNRGPLPEGFCEAKFFFSVLVVKPNLKFFPFKKLTFEVYLALHDLKIVFDNNLILFTLKTNQVS